MIDVRTDHKAFGFEVGSTKIVGVVTVFFMKSALTGFLIYHPTFLLFSVRILTKAVPQLPPPKTATLSLLFKNKCENVGF